MKINSIQTQQIRHTGAKLPPEVDKMGHNHTQEIADTGGDLLPEVKKTIIETHQKITLSPIRGAL